MQGGGAGRWCREVEGGGGGGGGAPTLHPPEVPEGGQHHLAELPLAQGLLGDGFKGLNSQLGMFLNPGKWSWSIAPGWPHLELQVSPGDLVFWVDLGENTGYYPVDNSAAIVQ